MKKIDLLKIYRKNILNKTRAHIKLLLIICLCLFNFKILYENRNLEEIKKENKLYLKSKDMELVKYEDTVSCEKELEKEITIINKIICDIEEKRKINREIVLDLLKTKPNDVNILEVMISSNKIELLGESSNIFSSLLFLNNLEKSNKYKNLTVDDLLREDINIFNISFYSKLEENKDE